MASRRVELSSDDRRTNGVGPLRNEVSLSAELLVDPSLPLLVRREGIEILRLELLNDFKRELHLFRKCLRLSTVV